MSGSNTNSEGEAFVLYVDHEHHPAPLSACYHATGARRLSSSVYRYPPSTVTETDSAFCPQSLAYQDAAAAALTGFCSKPAYQRCPLCLSVCSIDAAATNKEEERGGGGGSGGGGVVFFHCGNCDWDSRICGLQQNVAFEEDGSLDRLEMAKAVEDLGRDLLQRRQTSQEETAASWKAMADAWDIRLGNKNKNADLTSSRRGGKQQQQQQQQQHPHGGPEDWSVDALETFLTEKKKNLMEDSWTSKVGMNVTRIALDDKGDECANDDSLHYFSQVSLQWQALNSASGHQLLRGNYDDMLPLPVYLQPRISRRCRAELQEGRPGIILKPKLNPLEGDSSLRSGHGQWWKKDSSAIHVMPRVRVMQQHEIMAGDDAGAKNTDNSGGYRVILFKVTNPNLGRVRLRFAASSYKGELSWDHDDDAANNDEEDESNKKWTSYLPSLLVDELQQKYMNVQLQTQILHNVATTPSVDLLSAEDSFIELGGKARDIPAEVNNWTPLFKQQQRDDDDGGSSSTISLVASSSSTAWFQLVLAKNRLLVDGNNNNNDDMNATKTAVAVPLTLQIQVGSGSWDSSLIQPKKETAEQGEEEDWVSFDLVFVLA